MESTEQPAKAHERVKTDKSLTTERIKSDESFKKERVSAERTNDAAVRGDRRKADTTRTKAREQADAATNLDRENDADTSSAEIARANESLEEERLRADTAIDTERKLADDALHQERTSKDDAVRSVLYKERKATDQDLAHERKQTDSDLYEAAVMLADAEQAQIDMKEALTSRDEFLAIVSHDLRNPIGAISSCAEMMLEEPMRADLQGEAVKWIAFIKRNADTALRLVSDLLDVERISAGKLDLQTGAFDIQQLVKQSAENFVRLAAEKSITLQTIPPVRPIMVACDRDRIMQVLANLIGNALKFTPEQGTVTISVGPITGTQVQVSVRDTGPGIPNDKKNVIFERFSQLGTSDRQGLGLGLYIAKRILQAHHGKLWVESAPGAGSTFSFTLPLITH